ncbi:M20/M25/M40 family metallo-hydrolase [Glutamicibacter sp. NPDC087344]|uniref:M20/M25/M40 family metallo-hydrolase n=1 Tax=Glutamicibacter sp. NPDC087344 TaxID=3363994 RepID=UPI00381D33C1
MQNIVATRDSAISTAVQTLHNGEFERVLGARVVHRTESQGRNNGAAQIRYFEDEIIPDLLDLGFSHQILQNVVSADHPILLAQRIEDESLPTVLLYGHADVQFAHEEAWEPGLSPWRLERKGERLYGRGTADNKGQHTVNLLALRTVLEIRGALGFNVQVLLESGEEAGSVGLDETIGANRSLFRSDLFIGSDGPRYSAELPTIFLGSRGCASFVLDCTLREDSAHSGNWGGRLRNPATTLAAAISSLVDENGVIEMPGLLPVDGIPDAVVVAIGQLPATAAAADPNWGEPRLTPNERVFGWNTLEVIAMESGQPAAPVNAIPASARAHLHLRYVVGTDTSNLSERITAHLRDHGIDTVEVVSGSDVPASRLSLDAPVVDVVIRSLTETTGRTPVVLPNLGGTIPNAVFAQTLDLPTIWIPHSYPGSLQHAPNEHLLVPVVEEGLRMMAGVFWDLAENPELWASA